jgi:hypothetical protein
MSVPVLLAIVFAVFAMFLLFVMADSLPNPYQRFFGYFMIFVSTLELLILFWVLIVIAISDWTLWGLSFDDFWREQLSAIYFIKEWVYSWFWNDILNVFLVFLPAVVFLTLRTTFTTFLGFWALTASKRSSQRL